MDKDRIYSAAEKSPSRNSKPMKQQTQGSVTTLTFGGQEFQVINVKDYQMLRNEMDQMKRQVRDMSTEYQKLRSQVRQMQQQIMDLKNRPTNPFEGMR